MYEGLNVLCVIPARAGSRGIVGKNMRPLAGKPLIAYSFQHALDCPEIDRTIVSTDSDTVAALAVEMGLDVPFKRPAALAQDHVSTIDVLLHVMDHVEREEGKRYDILVLMHATAPLTSSEDVSACIKMLADSNAGSVFSVADTQRNPYFNMVEVAADGTVSLCKKGAFATRQEAPAVFELNSAVYAWRWESLKEHKAVIRPDSRVYVMPKERSVDIDDELDLQFAESILASIPPARG